MPTFVFASASHIDDLFRIRALPVSPHPAFSLFLHGGRIPLLPERDIERMRLEELSRLGLSPGKDRPRPKIGAEHVPAEGAYAGLPGVVRRLEGGKAVVDFGGWMDHVEIDAWLVPQEQLEIA